MHIKASSRLFSLSLKAGVLCAAALSLVGASVHAALPATSVDRWLEVRTASEIAESRLFELSRLILPICGDKATWGMGINPYTISTEMPPSDEAHAMQERVLREVAGVPGEQVFLVNQYKTPFAAVGIRRGDRLVPFGQTAGSNDEAGDVMSSTVYREKNRQQRDATNKAFSANSERIYNLKRGTSNFTVKVRAVPVCDLQLLPIDSQYSYASSGGGAVGVVAMTLPLMGKLNSEQLTIALAHEVAMIMLGNKTDSITLGQTLFKLIGKNNDAAEKPGKNAELGASSPGYSTLIQADRLAQWIVRPYGIEPKAYRDFLLQMKAASDAAGPDIPTYARTRPVGKERLSDVDDNIRLAAGLEQIKLPSSVSIEKLTEIQNIGRAMIKGRLLTLPNERLAAPVQDAAINNQVSLHRKHAPYATGFAEIGDVAAVPTTQDGRTLYRQYLTMQSPKAFVIYARGQAKAYSNDVDAMTRALDNCTNEGTSCWLYAVDETVVWSANMAGRIGVSARLRSK